jgi:simple sugar transport system permease protein
VAILIGFLAGALIGLIHGLIVTLTQIPSLIVTLASLMVWRSVVLIMTKGFPVSVDQSEPVFKAFSSTFHQLQVSVFWFVGLTLILEFVLVRAAVGNWIFATGGSVAAAQKTGIPTRRVKIALFMLTSVLASLSGMIQMTRFASVDPLVGQGTELTVIAAAVIGGTSLRGGFGSVVGAAFGVITFGMIQVGLQLASVPGYYFQGAVGLILLAAMIIQIYTSKVFRAQR